jgi:hypothetical protein
MRARSITAVVAALALLPVAPARAAGPQPAAHAPAAVKAVYRDFDADNRLSECAHTLGHLLQAYETMPAAVADGYPAFRDQLHRAIRHHEAKACPNDRATAASPTPTATPTTTATPTSTPESGQLPPGTGAGSGGGAVPPAPAITPTPTAAPTTAPGGVPPEPSAAAAPTPTPVAVAHAGHRSLTIPLVLIALAALGTGALAASAVAGRRSPGVRHAWREAAHRTRGTWADFSDWLRLGR